MKGIVSKALSNCGRVLPTAAKASKLQCLSVRPAAKRLAHQRAGQTINTPKPFGVLSNASGLREVNVDLLPREITWLSGAPGAGKGTNSKFISEICGYNAPTIVVSSLLELPEFKRIKDAGGIVDDAAVFKVLSAELAKPQYKNGVVVDGFPRTTSQAEWLAKLYKSSSAKKTPKFNFVMLYVNEETSISRQLARGQHIRAQNSILKTSGGILREERATDVCNIAAKVRYQGFIEKYEAISKTLAANQFSCYTVDAGASVESVRQSLLNSLTPTVSPILTPTCQPNTTTRFQRQFLASFENIKASSPIEVSTQLSFA